MPIRNVLISDYTPWRCGMERCNAIVGMVAKDRAGHVVWLVLDDGSAIIDGYPTCPACGYNGRRWKTKNSKRD